MKTQLTVKTQISNLAQTWNGCHSTRSARRVWKQTLLALLGCIFLSMPMAATAQDYEGFEFTTNADGISVTITAYTGPSITNVVNIPSTIDGLSVTDIGTNAFEYSGITSVTIPDSVTDIESNAFIGCGLANITIPESVTNIGIGAFEGCAGLTAINVAPGNPAYNSVAGVLFAHNQTTLLEFPGGLGGSYTIPDTVTNIGPYAFAYPDGAQPFSSTVLTSVTIPENVTTIGDYAFCNCIFLTNVTIGSGVISIGAYAFAGSEFLSVTIPNSVTNIGAYAFYDCFLTNVTIGSGVISIGDFAFGGGTYASGGLGGGPGFLSGGGCPLSSITIPDSVISIGAYAFYNCRSLTNVTLGSGVTSIGDFAFSGVSLTNQNWPGFLSDGCPLSSVTIPKSVTSIGEGAFAACASLTAIAVEPNNPAYASVDGVLFNQIQTTLIQFPAGNGATSYTIHGSVTSIGDYAFLGCANLTSITISDSVTNVGEYSFYDCSALTNVTIGDNVISLGAYAFSGFTYVNAFDHYEYACALASVTIPSSVTSIGSGAFQCCLDLGSVTIGSGVISIGSEAFSYTPLFSITIPSSVTSIGDYAFQECDGLAAVCFLGNAPTADSTVFLWDASASSTLPPTVYYLPGTTGWDEFSADTGLSTVLWDTPAPFGYTISNGTLSIASYFGPGGSASIPGEIEGLPVTSIGANAFLYTGLTSVTIPDSVTNIGGFAFREGDTLTNVYFEGNAPSADSTVFYGDLVTAYYLPGTTGWGEFSTNADIPTALWLPSILAGSASFGVQSNGFSFNISWATNLPVVVEACTDLANPVWQPLQTNTLTATPAGGAFQFSDPQWTNYPARFYRVRSQSVF